MNHELRSAKLIRIDSRDRSSSSISTSNFTVNLDDYFLNQIRIVRVMAIEFPNTAYNITIYNNQLTYDTGAGDATVTVPVGQYSVTSFLDELILQFAAEAPPQTLTYTIDPETFKIELTFTNAMILRGTAESTMEELIGLGQNDTASLLVHTMPNIYNFSGLQKLYVASNTLSQATELTSSNKKHYNVFTYANVDVPFGSICHRSISELHTSDSVMLSVPTNMSSIDIQLYNQHMEPVDLNGSHFHLLVKSMA